MLFTEEIKIRLCHNKQLINSHFYRGVSELPYKLLFAVIYTHLEFRYEVSHTITSHHVHHFIKLVSQMEHYLTIWFNTGNLYFLNSSFTRKSFYRKTIPIIKNFTFVRIFKTMQINNSVFQIFPYSMFNVVYSILIS